MNDEELPTPEEWARLVREWRDDATQRILRDKSVEYTDELKRILDSTESQQAPEREAERGGREM